MPYPHESSCTLHSSKNYDRVRRDNSKNPNIILGFKGSKGEVISFRYPTSHWTIERARKHCQGHSGSFHPATGGTQEDLKHSSNLSECEPSWRDIDQEQLPEIAFANQQDQRFAHHWVKDPGSVSENNVYTSGELLLHKEGLVTAWAAVKDAKGIDPSTIKHLQSHVRELGLTETQIEQAAAAHEVLGELAREIILIDEVVLIDTDETGIVINIPSGYKTTKRAIEKALESKLSKIPEILESGSGFATYSLILEPVIQFPRPEKKVVAEAVTEVISMTLPDHEPYLEDVLEGLEGPDGVTGCEKCLFVVEEGQSVPFVYHTQISGIVEDSDGRPGIYPTSPCGGRIRWLTEIDGQKVVFGISLPVSRLEEPDPLLSALINEPVPVSYLRPPQSSDWMVAEGYVEAGNPGSTKHRGSCYLKEDTGKMKLINRQIGYHIIKFYGERLIGTWVLEQVPGIRGEEWSISKIGD